MPPLAPWKGTIGRAAYALLGVGLALAKIALDSWLVPDLRGRGPWVYWRPGQVLGDLVLDSPHADDALLLALSALVFTAIGLVLTLQRLRSAGISPWAAILFFVPVVNVLFFVILCAVPAAASPAAAGRRRSRGVAAARDPLASALLAVVLVVPPATGLVFLCATELGGYGWGLFLGIPFMLGLAAAWIHGRGAQRTLPSSILVAMAALGLTAIAMLAMAIEGLLCIVMAVPIALPIALLGACAGHALQSSPTRPDPRPIVSGLAFLVPALTWVEERPAVRPDWIELSTPMEVDAPPELVWPEVIAFSELEPPDEFLFRAGVAYPVRAEIEGSGVGALRRCVFSTGEFLEPIEAWDEPRCLEFGVLAQPRTMRELSPWGAIDPPHLTGTFVAHRGRFLLEPLPGGRTRLVGTTWYTNAMGPSLYWRAWSDAIVHAIHRRVLEAIRARAEAAAAAAAGQSS
jgi:hypothetical protein